VDMAIISKYTKKYLGIKLPNTPIAVSSIYYDSRKSTSNYGFIDLKFVTIMKNLNISVLGKHDSLNDEIMTSMILLILK
ncbi:3'-5' exonuclease, partial [Aliarcobacter butzleri]